MEEQAQVQNEINDLTEQIKNFEVFRKDLFEKLSITDDNYEAIVELDPEFALFEELYAVSKQNMEKARIGHKENAQILKSQEAIRDELQEGIDKFTKDMVNFEKMIDQPIDEMRETLN